MVNAAGIADKLPNLSNRTIKTTAGATLAAQAVTSVASGALNIHTMAVSYEIKTINAQNHHPSEVKMYP